MRLHPKHGLNPTNVACYFCGQPTNELALLGYNNGEEAPRTAILDQEPCDTCKQYMQEGILLLGVTDDSTPDNVLRSGLLAVVKEDAIREIFTDEAAEQMIRQRAAFIPDAVWTALGLPRESTS